MIRTSILLAAAGMLLAACAAPRPMVVNETFAGSPPHAAGTAGPGRACHLNVPELTDARRAPDVLGVASGRAVKSPEDVGAWLRSIVGGLETRGFAVDFDRSAGRSDDAIVAKVSLQTAWITDTGSNLTANVVLHVQAARAGAAPIDKDYRGAHSSINWAGGRGELQKLLNQAFDGALDPIATDLRGLCPG